MKVKHKDTGFWMVRPHCGCPIHIQDHNLKEAGYGAFTLTGTAEAPSFTPSIGANEQCCLFAEGKVGCHYFITEGVAVHCDDSAYPGESHPLRML